MDENFGKRFNIGNLNKNSNKSLLFKLNASFLNPDNFNMVNSDSNVDGFFRQLIR